MRILQDSTFAWEFRRDSMGFELTESGGCATSSLIPARKAVYDNSTVLPCRASWFHFSRFSFLLGFVEQLLSEGISQNGSGSVFIREVRSPLGA